MTAIGTLVASPPRPAITREGRAMTTSPREFFACSDVTIWQGDSREAWRHLPEHSVDAVVTSPPYFGLRDYGVDGQVGLEDNPQEFINGLADLLTGYGSRVLKPGGSLWLNLGDSYASQPAGAQGGTGITSPKRQAGSRNRTSAKVHDFPLKSLLMIPERVALALISRGWILRNRVVWAKPNGMPSSVRDRLATKHEALFHLVRQPRYYYDLDAIREPNRLDRPQSEWSAQDWQAHRNIQSGRVRTQDSHRAAMNGTRSSKGNRARPSEDGPGDSTLTYNPAGKNPGDVWTIPTQPYPDAHFAVFPPELVRRPILATVPEGGTVLDPFFGSGTTAVMARRLGRKTVGVELNPDYCALAAKRFRQDVFTFEEESA
jgi:DNA modification methylase